MKSLETAENKIEKICEVLRKETLEPAEKQALEIIQEAKKQADEMILQAEKRALDIVKKAQEDLEQTRRIFESSLMQAARQGIEYLRQEVESKLFNPELENLILNSARSPSAVAMIIEALVLALRQEGLVKDLIACIPQSIKPQDVNALIVQEILQHLQNQSVVVGNFKAGAEVRVVDKRMTLVMTDEALKELLLRFLKKDFQKLVFDA